MLDVASADTRAQPLSCIAFVNIRTGRQLRTGGRPMCKALEEAEPVADGSKDGGRHPARVTDGLAEKRLGLMCVNCWLCGHVRNLLCMCVSTILRVLMSYQKCSRDRALFSSWRTWMSAKGAHGERKHLAWREQRRMRAEKEGQPGTGARR